MEYMQLSLTHKNHKLLLLQKNVDSIVKTKEQF